MYTKDILSISPQYMPQLVCPNSKLMYISKIHFEYLWSTLGHSILKGPQKYLKMYFGYFQNTFGKMMLKSISNTYLNTFGRSMHKGHNILLLYFWHTFDNYILTFTLCRLITEQNVATTTEHCMWKEVTKIGSTYGYNN